MRSELSLYFSRLNPLVMSLSTNQKSRDIGLLLQQVTTYDLYSEESNLYSYNIFKIHRGLVRQRYVFIIQQ